MARAGVTEYGGRGVNRGGNCIGDADKVFQHSTSCSDTGVGGILYTPSRATVSQSTNADLNTTQLAISNVTYTLLSF